MRKPLNDLESVGAHTRVNTKKPGADEGGKRLTGLGQQGNHSKEEGRGRLLPSVHHKIFIHQVRNDQFQQLAGAFCKDSVTERKTEVESVEVIKHHW